MSVPNTQVSFGLLNGLFPARASNTPLKLSDMLGVMIGGPTTGYISIGLLRGKNNKQVYTYTGSDQVINITPVKRIKVKCWGSGGGNGSTNAFGYGGTGGYSEAMIGLPSGTTSLTIVIGKGGQTGPTRSIGYGGGGGSGEDGGNSGGQGGGRTAVRLSSGIDIITAGGGGGGGYQGTDKQGGSGGGLQGTSGINGGTQVGSGGTQTAGGARGTGSQRNGEAGTQYQGGTSSIEGAGWGGGGGGGGWYGGGGGGGQSGSHGAGGGGSGFIGRNGSTALAGTQYGSTSTYQDTASVRTDTVTNCSYYYTRCLQGTSGGPVLTNDPDYVAAGGGFGSRQANGFLVLERLPP